MTFQDLVYTGIPRGIEKTTALVILVINVIAPGLGTILSAFLGPECEHETVYIGIGQAITTPLLGLGFVWAMFWSVRLNKIASAPLENEERPLTSETAPVAAETV